MRRWVRTRCPVVVMLALGLVVGLGIGSGAVPATYPDCKWNCNANDVQVTDAWLELSSGECGCDPSDPTALTAELWVRLWNHTGTDRHDIAFVGDLYINSTLVQSLDGCTDPLYAGATADLYLGEFQYQCGESVDLAEVVVSWVSSGLGTSCGTLDCPSRAAHCYGPTGLSVRPPLFVEAAITDITDCRDVTITATAAGAVGTVTYIWHNLPLGMTASGNEATGTLVDGTYSSPPNQIYVEATDERPCTAESNRIDPFTIDCGTELTIEKTDSPDPVEVLSALLYTITVENTGTADATNVVVTDQLPDRVLYVSSSCPDCPGSTCSHSAGVVTRDVGVLAAGDTATITIEVTTDCPPLLPGQLLIDPASCQETISNTASVSSDNADPGSFTVTTLLRDTTPPTFDNCPGDVTVECDSVPSVPLVTASDNCDLSVTVTYDGEQRIDGNCDGNYQLVRTWTATDDCDNTATCTQTITVQDTTPPTITHCPPDLPLACTDPVPQPSNDWAGFLAMGGGATDLCGSELEASYSFAIVVGCGSNKMITLTWTVSDDCGNSDTCVQTITVNDTTDPWFDNCPPDETVECDSIPTVPTVTASDDCDLDVDVSYDGEQRIDGNCDDSYQLVRTWTATDDCDNTATCTQTITVQDTTPPVITDWPADTSVQCLDDVPLPDVLLVSAQDNCSTPVITWEGDAAVGPCPTVIRRTYRATDDCGLIDEVTQTITVSDTANPTFDNCPPDETVACDSVPSVPLVTASDNCDISVTVTYNGETRIDGNCDDNYQLVRTWTATDDCDNTAMCTQTITVQDTTPPELTCPQDLTLECGDPTNELQYLAWLASASATDDCSTPTVTDNGPGFATLQSECSPGAGHPVTWTATDDCGLQDTCSATVRILDRTPPVITTCPPAIDLDCIDTIPEPSNDWNGFVSAGGAANDGCDTELVASYSDSFVPDCGTTGVITRTWTVTDDCDLFDTCEQTITITDTTPPELTCPQDLMLECGDPTNEAQYATWLASASATDDCSTPTVTDNGPAYATLQSECAPGTGSLVTWTATDDCGLQDTCSATVRILDRAPPVITTCPPAVDLDCIETIPEPSNDWDGFISAGGEANDGCDSQLAASYSDSSVGSCPIVITRTWTVTDDCGLTDTCQQTITQDDTTPPDLTCPGDLTLECGDPMNESRYVTWLNSATASDDCSTPNVTHDGPDFSYLVGECWQGVGRKVYWDATDDCGNFAQCSAVVRILDRIPPVIITCPPAVDLDCPEQVPYPSDDWDGFIAAGGAAFDDCDKMMIATYSDSFDPGCGITGVITRTWTVTDDCGLSDACDQIITITDTTPPELTCPQDLTLECGDPTNELQYLAWLASASATDDCSTPTVTDNGPGFAALQSECSPGAGYPVTWTATDACGLQDTCWSSVYILDETPPVITTCPPAVDLDCVDTVPEPSNDWDGFVSAGGAANDGCDTELVASYSDSFVPDCGTTGVITRTWTVTDDCDLFDTCEQTITITDTTPPELTCPQDLMLECGDPTNDEQYIAWLASATATDDCSTPTVTDNGPAYATLQSECAPGDGYPVTWTATDDCGLQDTCSATVRILDQTPPEITTCPPDQVLDCTEEVPVYSNDWDGFVAAGGAASDGCDTELTASFEGFGVGPCATVLTLIWTIADDCGLSATCTQTITIDDTTPPELTCPSDLTLECGDPTNEAQYIAWLASASATDDCSDPIVTHDGIPFNDLESECMPGTGTTVTWTALDSCMNQDQCSATVRILDRTPPVITTCPPDQEFDCTETVPLVTDTWDGFVASGGAALDGCDTELAASYLDVVVPGCGSTRTITRTWTVTDDCSLAVTCAQTITVTDTTPPELTCPQDLTLECGDPTNEVQYTAWLASASATDDCSTPTVTHDGPVFTDLQNECAPGTGYTVAWTATDACGLQDTCSATVRILDRTSPEITTCPPALVLDCADAVPYPSNDWNGFAGAGGAANDDCATTLVAGYSDSFASDCGITGVITRTWTVTDDCDLFDVCVQTITIVDTTAPELTCPQDLTLECGDPTNEAQYVAWLASVSATDDCSTPTVTDSGPAFATLQSECAPGVGVLVTWTATDACGLQDTCSATVRILDRTSPVITICPPDLDLDCTETIPLVTDDWAGFLASGGTASDSCDTELIASYSQSIVGQCPTVLTRTWTVTDECGLTDTCIQTITVTDTTPPQITDWPADVIAECVPDPDISLVTAIDDCDPEPIVEWIGDEDDSTGCPRIISRSYRATDICGNVSEVTQEITIDDDTPPEINCPPDIVRAGAGIGCDLLVTVPPITTNDCNIVSVFNDFNGSSNASGVYPVGTTVVNWTVIDGCGNVSQCSHTVTVVPAEPGLTVTKTVEEIIHIGTPEDETLAHPNDTIVFTIVVRNTGEADLFSVVLEDPLLDYLSGPEEDLLAPDVLDVGEIWVLTGRHVVTDDEGCDGRIVNTVRVTAFDPCGLELVALGSVDVDTAPHLPALCDPAGGGGATTGGPIINEIAWSGTPYSPEHEWIELFNRTGETIDLEDWTLGWRHRRESEEEIEVIRTLAQFMDGEAEDDPRWVIPLEGSVFPDDFYLLERYVQEVISDLDADLIYAEVFDGVVYDPDAMRLSDLLGEELYLFDANGFVVSAANTDYETRLPGGIPWPAGSQLPASMERTEYFDLADFDEYWATNLGIVIYGLDAARALLTATAGFPNEQAFMSTLGGDPLYQLELRQGDPLSLMFDLQDWMVDYEVFPAVTIYSERIEVVDEDDTPLDEEPLIEIVWIPEDEILGPHTYVHVLTEEFAIGEYTLFVTLGNGLTYRVDLAITPAQEE